MSLHLLTIVGSGTETEAAGAEGLTETMAAHRAFAEEVADAGAKIVSSEALQPVATATYLRNTRTDAVGVVDNPLPDAKQVVGGHYLIDAPDDDTALTLAKLCPAVGGYIELRPVWSFN